jgi:hypothetical protein
MSLLYLADAFLWAISFLLLASSAVLLAINKVWLTLTSAASFLVGMIILDAFKASAVAFLAASTAYFSYLTFFLAFCVAILPASTRAFTLMISSLALNLISYSVAVFLAAASFSVFSTARISISSCSYLIATVSASALN